MYKFHYIDAFTTRPFAGNPCAVFPQADGLSDELMQNIAMETNLSETSFVFATEAADFKVRYFTPRYEIPFAGHPTIATAYHLARSGKISLTGERTMVRFEFNIGVLPVEILQDQDGSVAMVGMQQKAPVFGETVDPALLAQHLNLSPDACFPGVPAQSVSTGVPFLIIPLKTLDAVRQAEMNRSEIRKILVALGVDAMFVCTPNGFTRDGDTFARLLSPDNASEDPYTGSATGCLGSFFYRYGIVNKRHMICEQGHLLGRPGSGQVEIKGSPEHIEEVKLFGTAVESMTGVYDPM